MCVAVNVCGVDVFLCVHMCVCEYVCLCAVSVALCLRCGCVMYEFFVCRCV